MVLSSAFAPVPPQLHLASTQTLHGDAHAYARTWVRRLPLSWQAPLAGHLQLEEKLFPQQLLHV